MHALASSHEASLEALPALVSLSTLRPRATAIVRRVGTSDATPLERRLIELGFVDGERIEVLSEARPGRDPFVVRVGDTTLALRRHEVATVWVELARP